MNVVESLQIFHDLYDCLVANAILGIILQINVFMILFRCDTENIHFPYIHLYKKFHYFMV